MDSTGRASVLIAPGSARLYPRHRRDRYDRVDDAHDEAFRPLTPRRNLSAVGLAQFHGWVKPVTAVKKVPGWL